MQTVVTINKLSLLTKKLILFNKYFKLPTASSNEPKNTAAITKNKVLVMLTIPPPLNNSLMVSLPKFAFTPSAIAAHTYSKLLTKSFSLPLNIATVLV